MEPLNSSTPNFYSDLKVLLSQNKDVSVAGNSYDTLLLTLSNPDTEAGKVIHILKDIEENITLLTNEHRPLVQVIMNMNWLERGPELISVFKSCILNLVSAHMFHLKPMLKVLVRRFIQDDKTTDESEKVTKKKEDLLHIHSLIKSLYQLAPTTTLFMLQILEENFPYLNKGVANFEYFTLGALTVSKYMSPLRMDILELVVKNMLKLDVRSSRTEINTVICEPQKESTELEDTLFEMEDGTAGNTSGSVEQRLATALPMAGSLDAMMTLCFQYIKEECFVEDKLNWEVTKKLYREMLSVFDKFIFPTHASCHVQFLIFYICSFKEPLGEGFIDYLWKKVTDPTLQCIYRQTAACYIGSFLTRAKYISLNTSKEVMQLMMKWVHKYLDQTGEQGLNADIAHHGTFYSVCQSAFYIFCFKHNDFMQMKRGHKWAESLNFQRVVTSKLNPLRVCVPIIVKTFASATRMHQLAFCDTIIERNNRYSLPITSSSYQLASSASKQLESYFPFDPYLLPRSGTHITPLYYEFRGSLPEEEELEDEDVDDFLPDEDDEMIPSTNPVSISLVNCPADFLQYGTSPGFKHGYSN
ncbi:RNA polymerase I-specific transcription initiation factor RRN3-like [Physella acuta]|uniref:RNA polymerase I-specific transcription initiation factor RRN3-like n=1 Tax=Physella acuta TaxID=109671 RepID=UPI0027DE9F03|nr:RNA polymerase I-specific transcription initiation factor RRN3-like [Physella acuta]XP_059168976.1 RNA polymerase I-specific transcription initiation factor RRN3-like [Physella acuta]XP_059168977.1 RNA polymerase I-specific transcription initiation factor RRN3-like [Physella acuta]XP_059168978.1 RNA polymerase I-specific transcription initiation factor RRN3-like [Physella acuta]XP_059168979.1 RNA polymerase I-specific transcription initiation factor RRN3-like [Physella acuta]XP_059168980.1 